MVEISPDYETFHIVIIIIHNTILKMKGYEWDVCVYGVRVFCPDDVFFASLSSHFTASNNMESKQISSAAVED